MLFLLFLRSARSDDDDGNCPNTTRCFRCLDANAKNSSGVRQHDCYFCWNDKTCRPGTDPHDGCVNTRTKECVEQLGGDAKVSNRYALGFTILAVALIIDVTVRVIACRGRQDLYANL
jgi:hypothetical protein